VLAMAAEISSLRHFFASFVVFIVFGLLLCIECVVGRFRFVFVLGEIVEIELNPKS
jgi:hypothetical protein